jgi:hypothetical protein
MKSYKDLLKDISKNILEERGYSRTSIEEVLEDRPEYDNYTEREIVHEIIRLRGEDYSYWNPIDEKRLSEQINKYSDAAFYRLCEKDGISREFGGFDEFARLSSGIVRHFLESCSMSYYFEKSRTDEPINNGISVEGQSEGIKNLSKYNLQRVRQNVDKHGPKLHKLIIDIGDILEEKLLNHTSEPTAQILTIKESDSISEDSVLGQVLYKAEESSVLIRKPGREPKNRSQPITKTYHINRIFTPALQIPSIYKWTTNLYPSDLEGLLDNRVDTRDRLMREKAMSDKDTLQGKLIGEYNNE